MAEYIVRIPTEEVPLERMCFPVEKITGELIRCKDCKYSEPACGNINCKKDGLFAVDIHPVNWFCADGSKKE